MSSRISHVGRSRTGLGLFATRPIRKGARSLNTRGHCSRPRSRGLEPRGGRYLYELNSRWTIDGSPRSNVARYFNHSCRPNAEAIGRKGKIVLVARRRILPGEEITYDYGKEYFAAFITKAGCRCVKCREKRAAGRRKVKKS